jgi:hypothetical protein
VDDRAKVADEIIDIALRNAVMAGIDRDHASRIMLAALTRERGDMELLSRIPDYVDARENLVARVRRTWPCGTRGGRCWRTAS